MKRKLLLAALCVVGALGFKAQAQASYNHTYTEGATVAAGGDYFLYNIGTGQFLTSGLNYGTRATVDNSGRVLTLSANGNGYNIYTNFVSLNNRDENTRKAGYLTTNGYVDTGSSDAAWVFTPVTVSGYTNAYTIKNSDTQYLFFDAGNTDPGCPVNVGNNTENNYSYWLLIPKTTREAAGDYSHYLINTQMNACWEYKTWGGSTGWNDNATVAPGGLVSNRCGEKYHAVKDIYQEVKEAEALPEGRYKFYAQGFWRQDGSAAGPVLYANADTKTLLPLTGTENSMNDASTSFTAGNYVNSVETFVNNNSLKVGINITDGSQWVIFDNFVLDYLGQCVMDYAIELPANGVMNANTWYYFDITTAADNYKATATELDNIICVTDGYTLTSATTGTVMLTATGNDFSATRYYVKSSIVNNLEIGVSSYAYTVGTATPSVADGSYVKDPAISVTFDATTNDPDNNTLTLLDASKVKVNGTAVSASISGNTLSFSLGDLALSADYTVTIEAGAVGYQVDNDVKASNAAVTLTYHTPLFADGNFYLKNKGTGAYFAGGLGWGTQAITNDRGHIVTLAALSDGKYTINTYLNNGGNNQYLNGLWCDGAATGWTFAADGEYYTISNNDGKLTAGTSGTVLTLTSGTGDNTKWQLVTPADWKAEKVATLNSATADNGVDATFYIDAPDFNRNDNAANGSWNGEPGINGFANGGSFDNYNAQKYNTTSFDVYQELTGLEPGAYKVTMKGFYRNGTTDDRNAILYANDYEVALVNIRSANITTQDDDKGFTTGNGDYFVPNTQADAAKTFNNGYYVNELNFVVGDGGTLRIGVKKTTSANADWAVFDEFRLTYYGELDYSDLQTAYESVNVPTLGFESGEYAPYTNAAALQTVAQAEDFLDNESAVTQDEIDAVTTALGEITWIDNTEEVNAIYNGTFALSENDGAMTGWQTDHSAGLGGAIHARAFVLTSGMSNYDNLAVFGQGNGTRSCAYMRFDGTNSSKTSVYTYGATAGYTMPLKAETYRLTAQLGGWGQVDKDITINVVNSNNDVVATTTVHTHNTAVSAGGGVVDVAFPVEIETAGDYKLTINNGSTDADNAIVISNIELYKMPNIVIAANGTSSEDYDNTLTGLANVTLNRPISEGYNTLVLPFDVTAAEVAEKFGAGSKVYVVSEYESAKDNIKLTAQDVIEANKPVILKATTAGTSYEFTNKTLVATETDPTTTGTRVSMIGSYAATTPVPMGEYVIYNNMLYLVDSEVIIRNTRAYISITQTGSAKPRLNLIFDGEEATGIDGIAEGESKGNGKMYDLSGREVKNPVKGIYIKNGKKVHVK